MVRQVEDVRVRGSATCLVLRRRDSSMPNLVGTLYMRANSIRNSNQILHGDQTISEEKFYMVDHATCRGQKHLTRFV